MMTMYSKTEIDRLKISENFLDEEENRYCIVALQGNRKLTVQDVHNHANFCILQLVRAYRNKNINVYDFDRILDKIDLFIYAIDMLGPNQVIDKLNKEVIGEEFHIHYFNSLCVVCEELYDNI